MDTTPLMAVGLKVTASMTTPSKPGKAPRPVWEVSGLLAGYEDLLYRLGGKRWRGKFSFWEDPTDALTEALQKEERTSFAERVEGQQERAAERSERYQERAERAEEQSEAAHEKFRAILDPIPFGQPILVGHHSEGRHRRALARADAALGNAVKESEKAKYYKGRAFSSSCKAEGHDTAFMHRRLREAEAELRRFRRTLADTERNPYGKYSAEVIERERQRYGTLIAEYTERVEYWKSQIEASGAGAVTEGLSERDAAMKASLKKGDFIVSDQAWWEVLRINAKTVTAQCLVSGCAHFKPRLAYSEIEKRLSAEEYAARISEKETK